MPAYLNEPKIFMKMEIAFDAWNTYFGAPNTKKRCLAFYDMDPWLLP